MTREADGLGGVLAKARLTAKIEVAKCSLQRARRRTCLKNPALKLQVDPPVCFEAAAR